MAAGSTRWVRVALPCLMIIVLFGLSIWLSERRSSSEAQLKPSPAAGYQSPTSAVAGFVGNMMRHRPSAACNYGVPADHGICAIAVEAMYILGGKITGGWTVGHAITAGNRAIVDVEYEACLGSDCVSNTNPNAGLPGSGTSFNTAFRQALANFDYATDCVRVHGRWYVDNVTEGP